VSRDKHIKGSSPRLMQLSLAGGVAFAVVVVVLLNILAARHYKRWDWTESKLYTLSPVTQQTLRGLTAPIEVFVLLSSADPMQLTVRHLLNAYGAETHHLKVSFVDPDRDPAEFIRVQQRFGIEIGKTEGGQVIADANIVVVRGEQRHFITSDDLLEIDEGDELRARPRVEEALTGALRAVLAADPATLCVTSGYGEPTLDEGGRAGMLSFQLRMLKLNYQVVPLAPLRELTGRDPISDCAAVVVAGPSRPLDRAQLERLKHYIESGGNAFIAVGPWPEEDGRGYLDLGIAPLLALAGVVQQKDFVFERDPKHRSGQGRGEIFFTAVEPHPITAGFIDAELPILMTVANSLRSDPSAAVAPNPLLVTSPAAFGMREFWRWDGGSEPRPRKEDHAGPLTLAYAVELPKHSPDAPHGPRMVVVGSLSPIVGANWIDPQLRGSGVFTEGALSWLVAEPIVLDLPRKAARPVGHGIRPDLLSSVRWKVLVFIPGAVLLLGFGMRLRRRQVEKKSRRAHAERTKRGASASGDDSASASGDDSGDDSGGNDHDAGSDDEEAS